eukprot:7178851-Pyramimonas_sp.AAC.1
MAVLPPSGADPVPVCVMRGIVHGSFPQTPAMSEHVGVALCGQLSVRSKFAGIRKFAHALEGASFIQEVRHVKAHRSQDLID